MVDELSGLTYISIQTFTFVTSKAGIRKDSGFFYGFTIGSGLMEK
jgi:hypothetical protein